MSDIVPLMARIGADIEMGERRKALYPASMNTFMTIEGIECVAIVHKNQIRRMVSYSWSIPPAQSVEVYKYLSLQDRVAFASTCRGFYNLVQSIPNEKYEMRIWTSEALEAFISQIQEMAEDQVLPLRALEIRVPPCISLTMIQRAMPLLEVLTLQYRNYKLSPFKEYIQKPGLRELNFVLFHKYRICRYVYHYRFNPVADQMSCCSKDDMRTSNIKTLARHARQYDVTVTALGNRLVEVDCQWRVPYYFCKMLLILSPLSCGVGIILLITANSLYDTMSTTTRDDGKKMYHKIAVDKDAYMWSEYLLEIAPYLFYIFGISAPFVLFYQCVSRFFCRSWPHYEALEDV